MARNRSAGAREHHICCDNNVPTLTAVFVSSSDALLPAPAPPALLDMLKRLLLLGLGRTIALMGRFGKDPLEGERGGEEVMARGGEE